MRCMKDMENIASHNILEHFQSFQKLTLGEQELDNIFSKY